MEGDVDLLSTFWYLLKNNTRKYAEHSYFIVYLRK